MPNGEIILYQPDSSIQLEVRMQEDTVWLTRQQMARLFDRDVKTIGKHINNALKEELSDYPVIAKFATTASDGKTYQIDGKLQEHSIQIHSLQDKVDFFVRTALPPVEGVFFDGQIFDAYVFAADLIRSAQRRIILIDNYIDDSVLLTLAKRKAGVAAEIVTRHVTETLKLDLERHNRQVPRTVRLPHTAAVALCGVIRMACLQHARGHIRASDYEHRFVGA